MADRNDWERDRERSGSRWDWDRGREWNEHGEGPEYRGREDWGREEYGRSPERFREHGERGEWGRQGPWGTWSSRPEWYRGEGLRGRGDFGRTGEIGASAGERGRYAGRGPKNYVRSDQRIWEDVNERLTDHSLIDATEIEVQVTAGEVTLIGRVEDRRSKRLAEDVAESVTGVKEVHNQLRSQGPAAQQRPSEDVERGSAIVTRRAS